MKKTVIVNINGIIFHIDEDAYAKLSAYLDALHRYFDQQTEGKEIVSDIESRIAELLQPLISEAKQSVTIDDIENIIETLGKPEDIAGEESEDQKSSEKRTVTEPLHSSSKRLYRDVENSVIGGVCSGISAYFDIDPVIVRVVFLILLFAGGFSLIVYPILWIVVPAAKTASQKLEMRGENITVNNIERTYHNTGQADDGSFSSRLRNALQDVFGILGSILKTCWRVFVFLLGLFLIVISITVIVALILAFFNRIYWGNLAVESISLKEFLNYVVSPTDSSLILIALFLIVLIPSIGFIYAGLKMVFKFKVKDKFAILSLSLLWIVAIITGSVLIFSQFNNYKVLDYTTDTVVLSVPKEKILNISMPDSLFTYSHFRYHRNPPLPPIYLSKVQGKQTEFYGISSFSIEKSEDSEAKLLIIREARGASVEDAKDATTQFRIKYEANDTSLNIHPRLTLNQNRWKFQRVRLKLLIPVGMKVNLNTNVINYLRHFPNYDNYWVSDEQIARKTWQMTETGLELLKLTKTDSCVLKQPTRKVLYIKEKDNIQLQGHKSESTGFGTALLNGKSYVYKPISLSVKISDNNSIKMQVEKNALWKNGMNPKSFDQSISFGFEQRDSILWIDPVFLLPNNEKTNGQEVNLTIFLPVGYKLNIGKGLESSLKGLSRKLNTSERNIIKNTWEMTLDGLNITDNRSEKEINSSYKKDRKKRWQ